MKRGRKREKFSINVNDIIGKRLGKLEVISYEGYKYFLTNGGERVRHFYKVQCDCGKVKILRRGYILMGKVRSCGCGGKKVKRGYKNEK